jgi:chitinase
MDLDRRVAQLRGQGGDAVISFGGQANRELAIACERADALKSAYRKVIDRYSADTVDFDVEGPALADTAANMRRAKAVKAIQDDVRDDGDHLAVWLTLPVTPEGLQPDALAVVRTTLAARVDLAGVDIMAMDFGVPSAAKDMRGAIESSIEATRKQLAALFGRAGARLNSAHLWRKLGVTVMIGQNDTAGERVTVADARAIAQLAAERGLGRVSTWSLNRDAQCGVTFAVIGTHSNVCSGVAQRPCSSRRRCTSCCTATRAHRRPR